jgi:ComF family protein
MRTSTVRALKRGLPQHCELCAAESGQHLVCEPCTRSLPRSPSACRVCALPLASGEVCGRCLAKPPAFERTIAAFTYAYPVDRLLHAFKYHARLAVAHWCASEVCGAVGTTSSGMAQPCIAAMPLTHERQRERGFNQALEIARVVSSTLRMELAPDAVRRTKPAPPQTSLPWSERAGNVHGAFVCDHDLAGLDMVVVDDVMTTGASLQELALTLRRAGARSVQNWVVARTLPPAVS